MKETIPEKVRRYKYEFFGLYGINPNVLLIDPKSWQEMQPRNGRTPSGEQIKYEHDATTYYNGLRVFVVDTNRRIIHVGLV